MYKHGTSSLAGRHHLHKLLQLVRILQADHACHLLAVQNAHQHGHGAHVKVKGQVVVLVNVHLEGSDVDYRKESKYNMNHLRRTHLG